MRTVIVGGSLLTPDRELPGHSLVLEDGKIVEIRPNRAEKGDAIIESQGQFIAPGLIDIHVHGGEGSDTMDSTPEALAAMGRFFAAHGVTSFLATTITAPPADIRSAIDNVEDCLTQTGGAQVLGVHLEGPYLNAKYKGAQPEAYLRNPDPKEYETWLSADCVRLITLAPELAGALELIRLGVARGIEFAVGHSAADYETVIRAADSGLRQATHTFNGMGGLHHREPGTVGAVLSDDRIYAQVIADGVHLHPASFKILVRAKGVERTILITDAMRAAGLEDGEYDLGGQAILVKDGVARAANGSLAGSTLTMDEAVRNAAKFAGLSFREALRMATAVPAAALGMAGKKGSLSPGADADITLFDQDFEVQKTIVGGELVYDKEKA